MDSILNIYKERLINISARNKSLVTRKLGKEKTFDIYRLKKFNENIDKELIDFIMCRKDSNIEILEDHTKYLKRHLSLLKDESKKEEELKLQELKNDETLDDDTKKAKEKQIKDDINLIFEEKSNEIKQNSEDMAKFSNNIRYLLREINAVEKETGRYELYIGYNFVEGKFKDGTFVRAPLLMFPIRIVDNKGSWMLKNILEQDILLNKVFLLAASKYHSIDIDKIETSYENLKDSFNSIDAILEYLSQFGLYIVKENKKISIKFTEQKKDQDSMFKQGELFLNPYLLLGQFPIANSIYDDYQELEEIYKDTNLDCVKNPLLNQLLLNQSNNSSESDLNESNEYYKNRKLKEEDYYFITPLDFSQEKAVKTVNETDQLVIYGPPGTGKSQTIANIIADALAKDKKVLMVSQKKAALDVIYSRLSDLNKKAVIIHDANKNKKSFYTNIINSIEAISHSESDNLKDNILNKAKSIDCNVDILEELADVLTKNRELGLSLQQMYSNSKKIDSKDDPRYEYYKTFRTKNIFKSNTYNELKNSIDNIESEHIFYDFYKYKTLTEQHPVLFTIKEDLDRFDIDDIESKLKEIQSNYNGEVYINSKNKNHYKKVIEQYKSIDDNISDNILNTLSREINEKQNSYLLKPLSKKEYKEKITLVETRKYFEQYLNLYVNLEDLIEEDEILCLASEINKEINGYLLEPVDYGKWYTVSYWKNKKANKQKEIDNKNLYDKKKEEIERILISYKTDIDKFIIQQKIKNKHEYEKRYTDIYNEVKSIKADIDKFKDDIKILNSIIINDRQFEYKDKVLNGSNLNDYISDLLEAFKVYEFVRESKYKIDKLNNLDIKILEYIFENSEDKYSGRVILNEILEFNILYHISEIEKNERVNIDIYKKFNTIVNDININLSDRRSLIPKYILNKLDDKFNKNFNSDVSRQSAREFSRQAKKKKLLWPIRRYIKEFDELLFDLFPCWLLSPETVSEILPLESGLFDIVIFDEASQMFIESAIPTIYRGKKVIIAGDDKQLTPSSIFSSRIDNEDDHEELETAAALEEQSLLDLAKVNYDSVCLNYHYRSKYDELINFSNYAFYGGKLDVSPNTIKTDISRDKPIERIKVDGRWIDRKNEIEAKEVVKLVKNLLNTRENNQSIGIITFNVNQQNLIEDMLEYECSHDIGFRNLYNKERDRIENNEDISLFIKNIENVQGDERDIIIFSTAYAPNEKNRVSVNFGSLSQNGGENRLNVAISRAREKIYVVTSIEPEELVNVDNAKNNGPKLLKKYLEYVRNISDGNIEGANIVLNSVLDSDIERSAAVTFDSVFEEEVYDALIKEGFDVDTQIGVSGYRIDLGIYDTDTSKYLLGIECDGAAYHNSKEARERDIHRQRYLESRGWKILRIWSRDWWQNPKNEIERINCYIDDLKQNNSHLNII